jgi:hypothetical protein
LKGVWTPTRPRESWTKSYRLDDGSSIRGKKTGLPRRCLVYFASFLA